MERRAKAHCLYARVGLRGGWTSLLTAGLLFRLKTRKTLEDGRDLARLFAAKPS